LKIWQEKNKLFQTNNQKKIMSLSKITSLIEILSIVIIVSACSQSPSDGEMKNEEDGHGQEEHGDKGTVSLTTLQMNAIGLKMVKIEERNMNLGVQVTGKLELAPKDRADISPILGGIIKEIFVIEGDKVKKGQVLATMEHPDFIQLQQDYINSLNTLVYLKKEFERQKKLYEEKVGSGKEFQKISAEYNNKKSAVKALKIKLIMLGFNASEIARGTIYPVATIVSPMTGTISLVETNMGAYVEPLTKLFEVVNNDKLHADFRVYEKDINKVKIGQKIFFRTTSLFGEEFEGKIHAISPVFEENPKALHVHADIFNSKENLIPGLYIQGRIIAENILTTVLPEHAIISEEDKSYIFVKVKGEIHDAGHEEKTMSKDEDHTGNMDKKDPELHSEEKGGYWVFEMVEVITGFTSEGYTEIKLLTPIPENAEIAGTGAYYLLAEMGKGETEHSH
jgi:membrane fusion protein, heavy metal efflux system